MAATALTVTPISRSGVTLGLAAFNADGHLLPNSGAEFVLVKNDSAGTRTVTATIVKQVDGVTPAAKSISIAAGASALFGPFPRTDYNNASSQVALAVDDAASVTIQAFRLTNVN